MEVNLSIMTKDQLKKFIVELDKENRKLKKDLEFVYGWKDQLEKENKSLNEEIERLKQNIMQDELEIIPKLEEENKKLKEEVKELKEIIEHYKNFEKGKEKLEGMLD